MKAMSVVVSVVGVVAALGLAGGTAQAQPGQAGQAGQAQPAGRGQARGIERSGFLIGFSLGGGSIVPDCSGCESLNGLALDIHLGGMLTPRLGLMFEGYGVAHPEEGVTVTNVVDTVALQYWASSRLWLKGGIGFGSLSVSDGDGDTLAASDNGAALLLALGVEMAQTTSFALDGQLRISTVALDEITLTNVSVGLGFNWY